MTRFRAAALAVAALVSIASPAIASPYSSALQAASARLDHAANAGSSVPDLHVPPAPLGGPPRYSPSVDDWLQASLSAARRVHSRKSRASALRSIAASLRYLSDEGSLGSPLVEARRDVGATAAKILSDPAYREAMTRPAPPPKPSIWERMLRWLFEKLRQLFGGLARATQGVPFLGDVFAIVLIGLAVAGLAYVAYRIAEGFVIRRRAIATADGEMLPVDASPDQLHAAALEAARDGRYARAVALLFQASLLLLDKSERVAYDPARTAGEYRRLVRRKVQSIALEFDALARIFTAAAYAQEPVGERDWAQATAAFAVVGRPLGAQ